MAIFNFCCVYTSIKPIKIEHKKVNLSMKTPKYYYFFLTSNTVREREREHEHIARLKIKKKAVIIIR